MIKFRRYLPVLLPAMLALSLAVLMLTVFFGYFLQNKMTNAVYNQELFLLESQAQIWNSRYRALYWSTANAETPSDVLVAENAVVNVSSPSNEAPASTVNGRNDLSSISVSKADGEVWNVWFNPQQMLTTKSISSQTITVLTRKELSALIPQEQRHSPAANQLLDGGFMVTTDPDAEKLLCAYPLEASELMLASIQSASSLHMTSGSFLATLVTAALIVFVISALSGMFFTYRPFKSLVKTNEILAASDSEARKLLTRRILWEFCTGARPASEAEELELYGGFLRSLLLESTMMMFLTDENPDGGALSSDECVRRCKKLMHEAEAILTFPHFLFSAPDGRRLILLREPLTDNEMANLHAWKAQLEKQTFSFTLLCTSFSIGVKDFPEAFELLRAAGYERFLHGMGKIQIVDRITDEPSIPELVSLQKQLEILRKPLENGNLNCSSEYITLLNRYRTNYTAYQAALLHVCNFLNQERLLLKTLRRHPGLPEELKISDCRTSKEAEILITDYVENLSACWSNVDKSRTENYIHTVEELINRYYTNPAFGVTQLAEHLQLTPTYLGKLYKEATGTNLIDRLSSKRSQTAEHLLAETDIPLSEVYRLSGYSSNNYFYRVFRKHHGITPLEYRKHVKIGINT